MTFPNRILLTAAASAIALSAAMPAAAQDGGDRELTTEIVVTAQRNNESQVENAGSVGILGDKAAEDVPFSIRSYNEALIRNQQPQTLGQLLENDPTIRTTYGFGNAAEQFVIRGFVLFGDDVGYDGLYGIAPRQLIAPELFESVQVLNGASAFLNGAAPGGSGLGGSVNVLPKRAGRDVTRATANYTSGEHFGGSFDVGRRFAGGRFGVRVNGAYRAGDVAIEGEYRETAVIGAAIDYDGGPFRFTADAAYQRVKVRGLRPKVQFSTAVLPQVPEADHNYAQPWTYTTLRDVFGSARVEYDVADNAMLYAQFGARDGHEEGVYGSITVTDAATGAASGGGSYIPKDDNNEAAQAGIRIRLNGGGISHEVNFGGQMLWQVNRTAYDFFGGYATNLYDTPVVAQPASAFAGGDIDDPFPISRTRQGSAFASDTIGFWGDRILLTGGLRLQAIRVTNYSYADGSQTGEYDESAVTPVVGLVVKPVPGLSFYANRIEALKQGPTAPLNIGDADGSGTIEQDETVINGGQTFRPFKTVQYEIGGKVSLGSFDAAIALYDTDLPIAYVVADSGGTGALRYDFYGTQRNRGVELTLSGELMPGLRLIAGGSINDAKLKETDGGLNEGNRIAGVPKYLANANVEWDVAGTGLTLTGRVVHTGGQYVDIANTLELDSWTRFDLGARYVFVAGGRPLTLRAGVDNVANERYWASAYDSFSPQLLQGAPRTFKASASIEF